jgi:hypothetical protein
MVVDHNGRSGAVLTNATIKLDGTRGQVVKLTHESYLVPSVEHSPSYLEFGEILAGSPSQRDLIVRIALKPGECPPVVERCSAKSKDISYEVLEEHLIMPSSASAGTALPCSQFRLRATIDLPRAGEEIEDMLTLYVRDRPQATEIRVHAKTIHPSVTISPSTINFGKILQGSARRVISIRRPNHGPLKDVSVQAPDPSTGIAVQLERNPANEEVLLVATAARKKDGGRFLQGIVTINLKGSRIPYQVPYFGYTD